MDSLLRHLSLIVVLSTLGGCGGSGIDPTQLFPGTLTLSAATYSITQSAGAVLLTVNRSGGTSGSVTASYATANGSASAGADFTSASGTLSWGDGVSAGQTISIPVSNATPFTGTKTFSVVLSDPSGGATLGTATAVVTINGSGASASTSSVWLYQNGVLNSADWPYDYSFGSYSENFKDTTVAEPGHAYDFLFNVESASSGWQPATNWDVSPFGLDLSGYTYMTFDVYPPAGSVFQLQWHYIGDIAVAAVVPDVSAVPGQAALAAGKWNTVKIPLAFFGTLDTVHAYKFLLQQIGSNVTGPVYFDNVGFVPGVFAWAYAGGGGPSPGWSDASADASANYSFGPQSLGGTEFYSLNGPIGPPWYPGSGQSTFAIDLSVTSSGGGLKLAYAGGFDISAFDHFTFAAIPTAGGYGYQVQFYDTAGTAVGVPIEIATGSTTYTPHDFGVNTSYWTVYSIPLSVFGSLGTRIGGFSICDASGKGTNTYYLSAIGFYK